MYFAARKCGHETEYNTGQGEAHGKRERNSATARLIDAWQPQHPSPKQPDLACGRAHDTEIREPRCRTGPADKAEHPCSHVSS